MTHFGFKAQTLEKYTRSVYAVFWECLYHNTAFHIKISPENPMNYLVYHYNQSREFVWSRHEFHVLADEVEGRFECECKLWEHTGTQIPVHYYDFVKFILPLATSSHFVSLKVYSL